MALVAGRDYIWTRDRRRIPPHPTTHEQFRRLFLQAQRELLRCVMVLVPNGNHARDVVQETAVALWQKIEGYDQSKPFIP
jgi:DNA-directed RNA polymerase specialized sigma24 family protein